MKDYDSEGRSEVFVARGGEPQCLLLTEIINLKKHRYLWNLFLFGSRILNFMTAEIYYYF
jgi:hypothetical protein